MANMNKLLEKSKNNKEIAEYSENNKYFDVAVSRYYYSLYQKIIYIIVKYAEFIPESKSTHVETLTFFKKFVYRNRMSEIRKKNLKFSVLTSITDLKDKRTESDYKNKIIKNKSSFDSKFGNNYRAINEFLDKLFFEGEE